MSIIGDSLVLLLRYPKKEVGCAAHSLAVVYATLTAMPGVRRATPDEAVLFPGSLRERMTLIALNGSEYGGFVSASEGQSGGAGAGCAGWSGVRAPDRVRVAPMLAAGGVLGCAAVTVVAMKNGRSGNSCGEIGAGSSAAAGGAQGPLGASLRCKETPCSPG